MPQLNVEIIKKAATGSLWMPGAAGGGSDSMGREDALDIPALSQKTNNKTNIFIVITLSKHGGALCDPGPTLFSNPPLISREVPWG